MKTWMRMSPKIVLLRILMALSLCSPFGANRCFAILINYENDPDLAMAMKYDGEYNGCNIEMASQSDAEKYYLKYLEKCTESSQRAKVYSLLGMLFSTKINREKGEKPDYKKAVAYMKKALEEEPERIGYETIIARNYLVTPLSAPKENLALRMENYEWIQKAKQQIAADGKNGDIWLPNIPGEKIEEREKSVIERNFLMIHDAQTSNLVSTAFSFHDPIENAANLQAIIQKFPGTAAEKAAQKKLKIVKEKMLEEDLGGSVDKHTIPLPDIVSSVELKKETEPIVAETNKSEPVNNGVKEVVPLKENSSGSLAIIFVCMAAVFGVLACGLVRLKCRR